MQINSIASTQTFKGEQEAAQKSEKKQIKQILSENKEKILIGLGALAVIGVATVAIAKNKKVPFEFNVDEFKKIGKFDKGVATLNKTGEKYTGKITCQLDDGSYVLMEYADGLLQKSKKTAKDGAEIFNKIYERNDEGAIKVVKNLIKGADGVSEKIISEPLSPRQVKTADGFVHYIANGKRMESVKVELENATGGIDVGVVKRYAPDGKTPTEIIEHLPTDKFDNKFRLVTKFNEDGTKIEDLFYVNTRQKEDIGPNFVNLVKQAQDGSAYIETKDAQEYFGALDTCRHFNDSLVSRTTTRPDGSKLIETRNVRYLPDEFFEVENGVKFKVGIPKYYTETVELDSNGNIVNRAKKISSKTASAADINPV